MANGDIMRRITTRRHYSLCFEGGEKCRKFSVIPKDQINNTSSQELLITVELLVSRRLAPSNVMSVNAI